MEAGGDKVGVKLLGAAILLAAGTALGFERAARLETRVRQLQALGLALRVLEKEVSVAGTPLPAALERSALVAPPVAPFLWGVVKRLSDGQGRTAPEAWREALEDEGRVLNLAPGDLEALRELGVTLGTSGRVDQTRHITLARERLAVQEELAQADSQRQGRLYRYLGVLVPTAILLVLW